jgi:biopolymer transport protein ExbD
LKAAFRVTEHARLFVNCPAAFPAASFPGGAPRNSGFFSLLTAPMPFKTDTIEEPTLNLTPMVDVVMLLMIFFMVGTEFIRRESQYEIKLPKVSSAEPLTALPDEIVVNVTPDGTIIVGGKVRTPEELEQELRAAHDRYADQLVVIRGDGEGPYQNVMTILNVCMRARITNIHLANLVEGNNGA